MARPNIVAKQYLEKVNWANEQIKNNSISKMGLDYDYCVLNDVGCGEVTVGSFAIQKGRGTKSGYHASINGRYDDPDAKSLILYMLIVYKYGEAIKNYDIKNMRIEIRGDKGSYRYMYCIAVDLDEKTSIKLSGDWILTWDLIKEFQGEDQIKIVKLAHSIMCHPIWPCERVNERNTVNQVRMDRVTMKDTLEVLKSCYGNKFKQKVYDYNVTPTYSNLEDAFMDYKEWYLKFKTFEKYVEFWDLKRFDGKDITKENLVDILS